MYIYTNIIMYTTQSLKYWFLHKCKLLPCLLFFYALYFLSFISSPFNFYSHGHCKMYSVHTVQSVHGVVRFSCVRSFSCASFVYEFGEKVKTKNYNKCIYIIFSSYEFVFGCLEEMLKLQKN